MNIYTKFENCYGIPFFEDAFKFNSTDQKASLIYAPNGFMKTSFADTMKDVCNERESRDFFLSRSKYNQNC